MLRSTIPALLLAVVSTFSVGCSRSLVHQRPADPVIDAAYSARWVDEVEAHAEDGDIVLRRGYAVLSDVITAVTAGADMSHAGIYDARTRTVIEAVDGGVKETNLDEFVGGSHHVMIVRPRGMRWTERRAAVEKARTAIGTPFDYAGFVGLDDPDRFYCSELVAWALDARERGLEDSRLIAPGTMVGYGETVWDSGERGEAPLAPARVASR